MFSKNIPGIMLLSYGTQYSTQKCICLTVTFQAHIIRQRRWKIQLLKMFKLEGFDCDDN